MTVHHHGCAGYEKVVTFQMCNMIYLVIKSLSEAQKPEINNYGAGGRDTLAGDWEKLLGK